MGIASVCMQIGVVLAISGRIQGAPFLYNSGKSFITSIFSPSPNKNEGNIEDLRVPKMQKAKLMEVGDGEDEFFQNEGNEDPPNSPIPGLIQKKIGKILTKLQLFSLLTNGFKPAHPEDEQSGFDADLAEDNNIDKNNLVLLVSNNGSTESNVYKINSPNLYLPPTATDNRITLYPAESKSGEGVTDQTEDPGNKISLANGSLGVYFMELLGGLATLIYGAALQVANSVNTSTPQSNAV